MLGRRSLVALAGCVAALAVGAVVPTRASTPDPLASFFRYDRPAAYDSLRVDVRVPMRDGAHLGCDLYVPARKGTSTPAPGRFPGIVDNFTPYELAYPFGAFQGEYFATHGYLDVECTPRGTGTSDGVFPGWFAPIEARDNFDLIEWLAHRPDSTGKVGQEGNSYGGMTAYRVAALHPPSLVAIAPQQAYSSLYLNYAYPGGIRSLGDPYWWAFAGAVGVGRPSLSAQEANWAAHPLLDDYWRQIDVDTKWDDIDVPVLGFGGWVDIFQDGMVQNFLGLHGPDTYLVDGPWTHGNTFDATVTHGALLAWFDRWLLGDTSAPLPPTHMTSYEMPNGPWQSLPDWPPPGAATATYALPRGAYTAGPAAGIVERSDDHLEVALPPVARDTTIAGAGSVTLDATLSDPAGVVPPSSVDTNFVVHLYDVAPSGARTLVTRGYLKASHRTSHTTPERLPLDAPVEYTIPLWHVHWRVAAGHHLVLRLQSGEESCCLSAAPAVAQPIPPLQVTVGAGSTLALPLVR